MCYARARAPTGRTEELDPIEAKSERTSLIRSELDDARKGRIYSTAKSEIVNARKGEESFGISRRSEGEKSLLLRNSKS